MLFLVYVVKIITIISLAEYIHRCVSLQMGFDQATMVKGGRITTEMLGSYQASIRDEKGKTGIRKRNGGVVGRE